MSEKSGYHYTYKTRGYSLGCQPGSVNHVFESKEYKFEIIVYEKELSELQINEYELKYLGYKE